MQPTVVSADLAYLQYKSVGVAVLRGPLSSPTCDLPKVPLTGRPDARALAGWLVELCRAQGASMLALDGPQGWRDPLTGITRCRVCERALNTPAKTGLPGMVLPANYRAFVEFSIAVFDAVAALGLTRLASGKRPGEFVASESFPLSAWRWLRFPQLPAKARASAASLQGQVSLLRTELNLELPPESTHDELQAVAAGLGALAWASGEHDRYSLTGMSPRSVDGIWREGFILNPVR